MCSRSSERPGNSAALAKRQDTEHLQILDQIGNVLLVAVEGASIVAVGRVTDAGEITLNYVSPDARFRGVSTAMLDALERRARKRGNRRCRLNSTQTALRFYLARGYSQDDPGEGKFGTNSAYPVSKQLE